MNKRLRNTRTRGNDKGEKQMLKNMNYNLHMTTPHVENWRSIVCRVRKEELEKRLAVIRQPSTVNREHIRRNTYVRPRFNR